MPAVAPEIGDGGVDGGVFGPCHAQPEECRAYTNPMWLIPVEVRARSAEQGIRHPPGTVDVDFIFAMSIQRVEPEVTIQGYEASGRLVGKPVSL
jgi:hypothetical protein